MPQPDQTPFWKLYVGTFTDPMLIVLIVCAFVSLGIEMHVHPETGWIDGTAILIAVQLVAIVTSVNDYTKEIQFRKLNEVKNDIDVKVLRNGEDCTVRSVLGTQLAPRLGGDDPARAQARARAVGCRRIGVVPLARP